jgi:hypothetical protein
MFWKLAKRQPQGAPVRCNWCRATLALQGARGLQPAASELHAQGGLAVKRLGWFCGRRCVTAYEQRFRVVLEPEVANDADAPAA